MKCKVTSWIVSALIIIGALNWGLWGFFQFDLVAWLFQGPSSMMSRVIYSLVGVAGVLRLVRGCCKKQCHADSCCHKESGKGGCCK